MRQKRGENRTNRQSGIPLPPDAGLPEIELASNELRRRPDGRMAERLCCRPYFAAMVTVLLDTPLCFRTSGTALPGDTPAGICTFTW